MCCGPSRQVARPSRGGRSILAHGGGGDDQQRREPRGGKIDEIVELRRRPAEIPVAFAAMADHAVGGVDRLVNCRTRKTRDEPCKKVGATTPSEKFSARLSIAARATPASSSSGRIAPDDLRHRHAARVDAALLQRIGHAGDMHRAGCAARAACWRGGRRGPGRTAGAAGPARRRRRRRRQRRAATSNAAAPALRRASASSPSRFSRRSSQAISRPIQVTGWPIDCTSRSG